MTRRILFRGVIGREIRVYALATLPPPRLRQPPPGRAAILAEFAPARALRARAGGVVRALAGDPPDRCCGKQRDGRLLMGYRGLLAGLESHI